ncbi:MAG: hypothetical protein RIF39_15995 [Cyclobacteriaceae bacterium]
MRTTSWYCIALLFISLVSSCGNDFNGQTKWKIVVKTDRDGNVTVGNKQDLINAIRSGNSVKIGWGGKGEKHSIEHLGEPIWLAVLDEQEVVAHLDPQVLSITDWKGLSANYSDSTKLSEEWRVVITTKGDFDAVWYDRVTNKQIQRRPQKHPITWFVENYGVEGKVTPLFLNE